MSQSNVSLVPGRECGGCTACCEFYNIDQPDLQKPQGVMCQHASGAGCGIYPNWPVICRTFFCTWRQMPHLTDADRPDRLGVIIWTTGKPKPQVVFERVYVIAAALKHAQALEQPRVRQLLDDFARHGALPVFVSWGGRQHMIHPAPDLADAILNPASTPHTHLLPYARAWLDRYLPFATKFEASRLSNGA